MDICMCVKISTAVILVAEVRNLKTQSFIHMYIHLFGMGRW